MATTPAEEAQSREEQRTASREELRAKFFRPKEPVPPIPLTWNGIDFEWRVPTLQQQMDDRDETGDRPHALTNMIINYSYVPGTDQKLFDPADYEMIMKMPMDGEFGTIASRIGAVMNVEVEKKVKN